ncbi:MAG: endonuclease III domain-containing protein [bacterium]|nr:endonuclease III domain-containing protein [bacterium]
MNHHLISIYEFLLKEYGPQGWWPLLGCSGRKATPKGWVVGYHPGDYELPRTRSQVFEVCLGAILTQNTGWPQVEMALRRLQASGCLDAERIWQMEIEDLKEAIRPCGYFNQKAKKVKIFTEYFLDLDRNRPPAREELLSLWGIGPETADSMLLYAFRVPTFVIDAYTRRILTSLGIADEKSSYHDLKTLFEQSLPRDFILYQEYHALLVEHAKRFYQKKSESDSRLPCPLARLLS